jgi:ribosome-associated protein
MAANHGSARVGILAGMPADDLVLASGARIERASLEHRSARSGGPGGQHVNTTDSKVEVRVALADLPISEEQRGLLRTRLAARIGADDRLRVAASSRRSQHQNRAAAEQRLVHLIDAALRRDVPRRPTRPSAEARRRRLAEKARLGDRKRQRSQRFDDQE